MNIRLRPREYVDDAALVALYNEEERDALPLSLELFRTEIESQSLGVPGELWVADLDGAPIGYAKAFHAWWTGSAHAFKVEICVAEPFREQGIGTALIEQVVYRLRERGEERLLGWIRADASATRRFTERHGFAPTGKAMDDYRLEIASATLDPCADTVARLASEGVRTLSLAEIGTGGDARLRAVQRLGAEIAGSEVDEERLAAEFVEWRRTVLHGPGRSGETYWVALEKGRPVGMTFLRRLTPDAAENDFTGVAPSTRGRGIATLLKMKTIAWAPDHGVRFFYTAHEVTNAPMIAVNTGLGYQRGAQRLEVARDLH